MKRQWHEVSKALCTNVNRAIPNRLRAGAAADLRVPAVRPAHLAPPTRACVRAARTSATGLRYRLPTAANHARRCFALIRRGRAAPDVQILVIDKTGATPGASWQEQLKLISWGSAATLEDAWERLKHLVEAEPTNEPDDDPEEPSGNLFVPYIPAKLKGGGPHPVRGRHRARR